jgi:chaperonin cofactor prefoldin
LTRALPRLRAPVGVTLLSEKKEALHRKADLFVRKIKSDNGDDAAVLLYDILDTLLEEEAALREEKSDRSEIRELIQEMRSGFAMMDKRFEDMQKHMDKRFEDMQKHMDKRFEDMQKSMDKRFEDVNRRFDDINRRFEDFNKRFEDMQKYMDKRFDDVNKRFEDVNKRFDDINRRFEDVNKRFDDINRRFEDFNKRFSQLQWLISLGMTLLTTLIVTLKIFAK